MEKAIEVQIKDTEQKLAKLDADTEEELKNLREYLSPSTPIPESFVLSGYLSDAAIRIGEIGVKREELRERLTILHGLLGSE